MFRIRSIAAAALLLTVVAGCDSDDPATSTATDAPIPEKIVSLSPTHTEVLFAIGAGDQVIAVDDQSNYPAEALDKPNDLSGFEPNVEAIAALQPDLVVIADNSKGLADQLEEIGVNVWLGEDPGSFDDVYAQIEELGEATGHSSEAAELVAQMKADIEAAIAAAGAAQGLTYYHELDPTLYTVTGSTFIGQVYGLFGMESIGDGVEEGNDYPQLNAEYVIDADPDLIVLADTKWSGESPETVAARPGWDAMSAVKSGNIVVVDDDIASRWGPRLVDFVEVVAAALATVPAG